MSNSIHETVFRSMNDGDFVAVRHIHESCLPVRYTTVFYKNLVRHVVKRKDDGPEEAIYTEVAVLPSVVNCSNSLLKSDDGMVAGLITAQMATPLTKSSASRLISFAEPNKHDMVSYILTLAIMQDYRKAGIGSALLNRCVLQARAEPRCGAIYLHVITYNTAAILFYERAGFIRINELEEYYLIDGKLHNCYLYALFLNGAGPIQTSIVVTQIQGNVSNPFFTVRSLVTLVSGKISSFFRCFRVWLSSGYGENVKCSYNAPFPCRKDGLEAV